MDRHTPPFVAVGLEGREVWIDARVWAHVLAGHPEMVDHFDHVESNDPEGWTP